MTKKEKAMADRSAPVSSATSEREKAIDLALQQIERRFGKGTVMKLGEATNIHVEVIPTGSIALDLALGVGGVPRGRVTEIYGPESSGKTTLCQHIIANAQRAGGYAAFIDAEHALDPSWAKKLGVELETLLVSQPGPCALTGPELVGIMLPLHRPDRVRLGDCKGNGAVPWIRPDERTSEQ